MELVKFLDLIAFSEGTSTGADDGYGVIVTGADGKPESFSDYSDHPFVHRDSKIIRHVPLLTSSASGRYQLECKWWTGQHGYKAMLGLPDFGPVSQDRVALRQIAERHATADIIAGNIASAIAKVADVWVSFPGTDYVQGNGPHKLDVLLEKWKTL